MPGGFHFLGAGSVGSLWAALFRQRSDAAITLILREARYARKLLRQTGDRQTTTITVERNKVNSTYADFQVEWLSAVSEAVPKTQTQQKLAREIDLTPAADIASGPISSLIVATKAGAVLPSLTLLASRLSADSTIVLIQNGAGNYESIIDELFRDRASRPSFIVAITTHGCWRRPKADNIHTVWGSQGDVNFMVVPSKSILDSLPSTDFLNSNPLIDLSSTTIPDFESHLPSIPKLEDSSLRTTIRTILECRDLKAVWLPAPTFRIKQLQKLVGNAVINPLTALMDVPNGCLLQSPEALNIAAQVCSEAAAVFNAQSPTNDALSARALYDRVIDLAKVSSSNISSTLSDVRNKSNDTEIDYFNGYLSRLGQQHGIATPANDLLCRLMDVKMDMLKISPPKSRSPSPNRAAPKT